MFEKGLDYIFNKMKYGGLEITFPSGRIKKYGKDKTQLKIHIKKNSIIRKIARNQSLGFGEAYMKGDIEVEGDLRLLIKIISKNKQFWPQTLHNITGGKQKNIRSKQRKQIAHHYDIGNDFYEMWLDKDTKTYSCAYFKKKSDTLETAQKQKNEYILKKLRLKKGMSLLDIGSGWGDLIITAAKKYGVKAVGITLSKEQVKYSKQLAKKKNIDHLVKFRLANYQDIADSNVNFDRIVSVGMFEHVGQGNHDNYFKAINKMLVDKGVSVLHTITQQREGKPDPWIDKYIFPGGYIPSIREVVNKLPDFNFDLCDYENLRMHYAMTLDEWLKRYRKHKNEVLDMFDEEFYRMWELYLVSSAGAFRYNALSLSQYVFTKGVDTDRPLTRDYLYK